MIKERLDQFISSLGIDIIYIQGLPNEIKSRLLIEQLLLEEDKSRYRVKDLLGREKTDNTGLVVVKPEMFAYIEEVTGFLANLGLKPKILPTRYLDKDQWLRLYGYMIADYPDIIFLYIHQRALGLIPITFDHLPIERYTERLLFSGLWIEPDGRDLDNLFERCYCGGSLKDEIGTLRGDIVRRHLVTDGFSDMSGRASLFDRFDFFKHQDPNFNLRVFNGVHIPNSRVECACDLEIFLK